MTKNLVIVESPAKAKTIKKYLGEGFEVMSSNGHIRDLATNKLSINIDKNFEPEYLEIKEKQKLIKELKSMAAKSDVVWLATDEDREGEAISWHLSEVMNLDPSKRKRIVFHEITKNAILAAKENPRDIDQDLVNAQQARRILDRLVGFKLSPVLWKKVKPALSAGRVQSVAVRLIVDREREIIKFKPESFFRTTATFFPESSSVKDKFPAELKEKFSNKEEALKFLESLHGCTYTVGTIEVKDSKRSPAPPFTTSTLQQEASRKLGYSVAQTMRLAQSLYEAGHITYMRTDSVRLSNLALAASKEQILSEYGKNYLKTRNFTTKSKSAQEAHEAIRPTDFSMKTLGEKTQESRLYELIWKRTVASQMTEATLEKTTARILISGHSETFTAIGEVIKFDGFLKLYRESTDDENGDNGNNLLPRMKQGDTLTLLQMDSSQRFTRPPARYSEAMLVKKMEELGIGRPSTYAPTISTIQKREYVIKESRPGTEREFTVLSLRDGQVSATIQSEKTGGEKNKLFPCSIGMVVNDFLVENFDKIVDYHFTAKVESEFDKIAEGKLEWQKNIATFYFKEFQPILDAALQSKERPNNDRELGIDPKTGKKIFARIGRYGPFIQLGEKEDSEKPRYAKLKNGQLLESITLEEALSLLEMPRNLGKYEGHDVIINIGRFGPYVDLNRLFCPIPKTIDPYQITFDQAVEIIKNKRETEANRLIAEFEYDGKPLKVLNGRWGPYVSYEKKSYKIPRGMKPEEITAGNCKEIIDAGPVVSKKRRRAR